MSIKPISPTGRLNDYRHPTPQQLPIGTPEAAQVKQALWTRLQRHQGKSWAACYICELQEARQRYLAGQREIIAAIGTYLQSIRHR